MVTVSENLKKGVENFLGVTPQVTAHMENSENPHGVTKSQVGLSKVLNEEQATKAEFNLHKETRENPHSVTKEQVGLGNVKNTEQATKEEFLAEQERVTAFMERCDNPHGVTKSQVGLGNLKDEEQATKAEFLAEQERVTAHMENADNPHGVTKSQVGLGNLKNEEQATAVQYAEHIGGSADKHSGADIMYSDTKSVNEKIDELIVEGGSGTMYHNELSNRDLENQHPISAISGLRGELDALEENFSGISHDTLSGRELAAQHPISAISGLSENLDTILIYEGITTDGNVTELKTKSSGEFVSESKRLYHPAGTVASIEVDVIAAKEEGGIIKSLNGACHFKTQGFMFQLNSGGNLVLDAFEKHEYADGEEIPYTAALYQSAGDEGSSQKNLRVCRLCVKGAAEHRVFWRAVIRIKNNLKVEAEA